MPNQKTGMETPSCANSMQAGIDKAAAPDGCGDAECHAKDDRYQESDECDLEGRHEALRDRVHDRLILEVGIAHLPAEEIGIVGGEAYPPRTVQPQCPAYFPDRLFRRVFAEQDGRGIARQQLHDPEGHGDNPDQHRDKQRQPSENIGSHLESSRRPRRAGAGEFSASLSDGSAHHAARVRFERDFIGVEHLVALVGNHEIRQLIGDDSRSCPVGLGPVPDIDRGTARLEQRVDPGVGVASPVEGSGRVELRVHEPVRIDDVQPPEERDLVLAATNRQRKTRASQKC